MDKLELVKAGQVVQSKSNENITMEKSVSDDTKLNTFKADRLKSTMIDKQVSEDETRPRNLKANVLPIDGYGLEVDGRVKSQYETAEAASGPSR